MLVNRIQRAERIFSNGFNCAQAVFSAFAPSCGIGEHEALKIASGFGSGMGRLQEVCGAVTGAFMALGARNGSIGLDDATARAKTYEHVQAFSKRFIELHGSIICRDLIGVDLSTEEGQRALHENGLLDTVCAKCVRDAAEIVEDLISKQ